MSGDYTRFTYNPLEDHAGVFMQQGRVQLDADWNELVEIFDRRWRAETIDIIGRTVVPRETPDGFKIAISGTTLTIGRGRIYVHGLLAENHGTGTPEYDPVLEEVRGPNPTPYLSQPYYPNPAPLPFAAGGALPVLVYVDVWHREITALEDPDLVEKAVGVDTATRLQTAWQVRFLANVGNITCSTPDDQVPGWLDVISPSAARLTTAAVGVPSTQDPCTIPPNGGFRGTENRLYRVEIHDSGPLGTATFKWSRDNASVATSVTSIDATRTQLSVVRIGRDAVLRFNADDWVEITDDWHELSGKPGVMRKVQSVDEVSLTLTLAAALPAGEFDATSAGRHTRVRRWDQKGIVRDAGGNPVANMDASGGVIPIPAATTNIVLEDGVQITFSDAPAGGKLHSLDYWVFAARTADASVEVLTNAAPRGVNHHFARLAVVTFPSPPVDCRTLWPPDIQGGCDCNACVSPASHNNGTFTIQMAIDQVSAAGGKVCLGPGIYNLGATPVTIQGAQSVRVEGRGSATILLFAGTGPAFVVANSANITLSYFAVLAAHPATAGGPGTSGVLAIRSSALVTVERCILFDLAAGDAGIGAAILLQGALFGLNIRDNVLFGTIGILSLASANIASTNQGVSYALTWDAAIEDNLLWCRTAGISFDALTLHAGKTNIRGNSIYQCASTGIFAAGWVLDEVLPGSQLDIQSNSLGVSGTGILIGTRATRVIGNDIGSLQIAATAGGIVIRNALDKRGPDGCQVIANRIFRTGDGILIAGRVRSVMIKQNLIDSTVRGGIVMDESGSAQTVVVENNVLRNIAPTANTQGAAVVGIHLQRVERAAITGNVITGVGAQSVQNAQRAGIRAVFCGAVRIGGNQVIDIGPSGEMAGESEGIDILPAVLRVDVSENLVRRNQNPPAAPVKAPFWALRIGRAAATAPVGTSLILSQTAQFLALSITGVAVIQTGLFVTVGTQAFILPRVQTTSAVRGNHFEAYGGVPIVEINQAGACALGENHCLMLLAQQDPAGGGSTVISAIAGAITASANYVSGARAGFAVSLSVGSGPFTVLGNITSAPISVNGAALAAPWAPLNVIGV